MALGDPPQGLVVGLAWEVERYPGHRMGCHCELPWVQNEEGCQSLEQLGEEVNHLEVPALASHCQLHHLGCPAAQAAPSAHAWTVGHPDAEEKPAEPEEWPL